MRYAAWQVPLAAGAVGVCVIAGVGKALGPPPTNVGQSPQPSVAVSGTETAVPATAGVTQKVVCWVPAGSGSVKLPVRGAPLPVSMSAFVAAPNCTATSVLLGTLAFACAVSVARSRPPLSG